MRRAFAAMSLAETAALSSKNTRAFSSTLAAWVSRRQSRSESTPFTKRLLSISASPRSSRSASSRLVISSEKNATQPPKSTAWLRAMLSASAVFPTLGRAASTITSPPRKPPVSWSNPS